MKEQCWTCGQEFKPKPDSCCEEPIKLDKRPPKEPPPHCSIVGYVFPERTPDNDWFYVIRSEHPCCMCRELFFSTRYEWLVGECPKCGAKGEYGDKE